MARQASLTSEGGAQQRRENAEEAALQQAGNDSAHHVEATKAAEDAKTIDRRWLQALLRCRTCTHRAARKLVLSINKFRMPRLCVVKV